MQQRVDEIRKGAARKDVRDMSLDESSTISSKRGQAIIYAMCYTPDRPTKTI